MSKTGTSLQALYLAYAKELTSFARRRLGSEESRDAVHDAYLRLATYGGHEQLENPRAYLYRVTSNVANDYGRRALQRDALAEQEAGHQAASSTEPGPELRLEHRRTLMRCLTALNELPEAYRHAFLLHRVDGMPQAEIAASLGIPRRTVERYIAKALAHCLDALAD